ncbi:GNAT family N-acetyltransferase [Kytococcus sedentarius]|uniref:GNAT family N-acetyltransferase n=1 Tax=Kytococcus sedentarius TaxID=1276 RepID=UPI0035BC3762
MTTSVRDNPDESRYEVYADEQLAGFSGYRLGKGQIAFTHTEVDDSFSGRGLAGVLVAEALADSRQRGLAVLPFCPYVRAVIARSPEEYLDLVRPEDRARFALPAADGEGSGS